MSRRTSSRSTLTIVPETKSPSLKYLMVSSMAARKSSAEPMSLTATCGVDFCSGFEVVIKDGLRCGQLVVVDRDITWLIYRFAISQAIPGLRSGKRSEEHTSELQSRGHLVCRLLLE